MGTAYFFTVISFCAGLSAGIYLSPTNEFLNRGYFDSVNILDYRGIKALYGWLKRDTSERLGIAVFTVKSIYLYPNLDPAYEFLLAIRRKSDGLLVQNYGIEKGKTIAIG